MKVNGQLHALAALPSDEKPPVSNGQKAGWPQGQSKNINFHPFQSSNVTHPARGLVSCIYVGAKSISFWKVVCYTAVEHEV
jgi:hypothetical protein